MRCPICPENTATKFKLTTQVTKHTAKFNCKSCGFPLNDTKEFSSCQNCKDYTLCINCKVCSKGHPLCKIYNLSEMGGGCYKNNEYYCNECSAHVKNFEFVWHCRACSYDLCNNC